MKYITYIENERFAVGTTGRSVHVFGEGGQKLAEFRDLTYAYFAAFTPDGDGLIVKSNEGKLALYSLTELKLIKKLRCGASPQDGCFCFSSDGTRFLNAAMHEKPRRWEIAAYSANGLDEIETVFSSEKCAIFGLECGDGGSYYVLGSDDEAFVGVIKDGALIEKYGLTFEKSALYIDALRLRRTGYTEEGYKSTFAATGMLPSSPSIDEFKKTDLTLKQLIAELKNADI